MSRPLAYACLILAAYGLVVGSVAWINHGELESRARCCGLYGDYGLYYLPFPLATSSERSDWGGGPTKVNPGAVLLDVLLPLVIGGATYAVSRRSAGRASGQATQI